MYPLQIEYYSLFWRYSFLVGYSRDKSFSPSFLSLKLRQCGDVEKEGHSSEIHPELVISDHQIPGLARHFQGAFRLTEGDFFSQWKDEVLKESRSSRFAKGIWVCCITRIAWDLCY